MWVESHGDDDVNDHDGQLDAGAVPEAGEQTNVVPLCKRRDRHNVVGVTPERLKEVFDDVKARVDNRIASLPEAALSMVETVSMILDLPQAHGAPLSKNDILVAYMLSCDAALALRLSLEDVPGADEASA